MYQGIKEIFCKKFEPLEITIEDNDLYLGNNQFIPIKDWHLRWVMQQNERGAYIEYYGINGHRGHLHGRIYDDGGEENLEVLREYIAYSPNIQGDRERSTKDSEAYNKRLMTELKSKGLL